MSRITSVDQLRGLYRAPSERAVKKQLTRLDPHCRRFIELSPFLTLATSSPDGQTDVSPRGGEPGFVRIVDDRTVVIPDSPGNNRLDSLANLVQNPEMALAFLVPGVDELLRINGTAEVRDDPELVEGFVMRGRAPKVAIVATVREAYLHCAKAIMRSRLWHDDARIERSTLPSMGQMLKDQIGGNIEAETQEEMVERYHETLY